MGACPGPSSLQLGSGGAPMCAHLPPCCSARPSVTGAYFPLQPEKTRVRFSLVHVRQEAGKAGDTKGPSAQRISLLPVLRRPHQSPPAMPRPPPPGPGSSLLGEPVHPHVPVAGAREMPADVAQPASSVPTTRLTRSAWEDQWV